MAVEIKENGPSNVSDDFTKYMFGIINKIINEAGCRIPCSINERKGATIVAEEMKQIADEVNVEEFEIAPNAFLGWIRLDVGFILISYLLYFLASLFQSPIVKVVLYVISTAIILVGVVIIWEEFFNYREFTDKWYKKEKSQNVIGKIRGPGETKRLIIFSGHIDSAIRFNLLEYFHYLYPILCFLGLFTFFIWTGASLYNLVFAVLGQMGVIDTLFKYLSLISLPAIVLLFFFLPLSEKQKNSVPGAVDNLSAIAIVLAVGKYLKEHPEFVPSNTEIRLIGFGCEEAGLRGAYRYVEMHSKELRELDTYVINMDGIQDERFLKIMEIEPTTRTLHSKELTDILFKAGQLTDVKIAKMGKDLMDQFIGLISGGTDAAAFSKAKIKATSIVGMNFIQAGNYYHQTKDTPDKIRPESLNQMLKLLIKSIELIDSKKN